jgi:hypothetical protein
MGQTINRNSAKLVVSQVWEVMKMHARFTGESLRSGHLVLEDTNAKQIQEICVGMGWKLSRLWVKLARNAKKIDATEYEKSKPRWYKKEVE